MIAGLGIFRASSSRAAQPGSVVRAGLGAGVSSRIFQPTVGGPIFPSILRDGRRPVTSGPLSLSSRPCSINTSSAIILFAEVPQRSVQRTVRQQQLTSSRLASESVMQSFESQSPRRGIHQINQDQFRGVSVNAWCDAPRLKSNWTANIQPSVPCEPQSASARAARMKRPNHEKRNVNQLVAAGRMPDCDRGRRTIGRIVRRTCQPG